MSVVNISFRGTHAEFLRDDTAAVDLEGSLSCGKTTVCLYKEIESLKQYPGMHSLVCRWTDDATNLLLRPALEQMARIRDFPMDWNDKQKTYECDNGSRIYSFGLKTQSQDPEQRYGKIRGLPVSRIYVDQAEQLPGDIAAELLLRLRPDLEQNLGGQNYPRQLTFSPNPTNHGHWLDKQFPVNNRIKGRKYYSLSIYDNKHNLPEGFIENALIDFPPAHPKHQTVILGQRGPNIIGDPVFDGLFDRAVHLRPIDTRSEAPLLEAFELGQHNPVWVVGQRTYHGGLVLLGGIVGRHLMLQDFLPMVKRYRADWFPHAEWKTATGPMGETATANDRFTLLTLLRREHFQVQWRDNANALDVRLAMIESLGGLMRRRTMGKEEAFGIHNESSRWLEYSLSDGVVPRTFLAYAFDGGYTWESGAVSVSNKQVRRPHNDEQEQGYYANAARCVEHLMQNFCADIPSDYDRESMRHRSLQAAELAGPGCGDWMGL